MEALESMGNIFLRGVRDKGRPCGREMGGTLGVCPAEGEMGWEPGKRGGGGGGSFLRLRNMGSLGPRAAKFREYEKLLLFLQMFRIRVVLTDRVIFAICSFISC